MNKTKGLLFTASLVLAITFTISCEDKEAKGKPATVADTATPATPPTFTDSRDGKTYKKVVIGSQTWMAENLNFAAEGSKCYEDKPENCEKYGRLYDWETAKKSCPNGWHLPSCQEYNALFDAVGGNEVAGKKLKAKNGWNDKDGKSGNGTDEFGFSALPGGYNNGAGVGISGTWSSTCDIENEYGGTEVVCTNMYYSYEGIGDASYGTGYLVSVRCIQN